MHTEVTYVYSVLTQLPVAICICVHITTGLVAYKFLSSRTDELYWMHIKNIIL